MPKSSFASRYTTLRHGHSRVVAGPIGVRNGFLCLVIEGFSLFPSSGETVEIANSDSFALLHLNCLKRRRYTAVLKRQARTFRTTISHNGPLRLGKTTKPNGCLPSLHGGILMFMQHSHLLRKRKEDKKKGKMI
ncbi:hypothetical protein Cni_G25112 [Canna indica]|uniref:Uncharacterized protein n=1 Tax=Canna indica TaxID=4628 RepID=A0AAQ3KXE1_9LILI|nr:hypothetical protein Cni_G25112 [Canna indica]